MLPCLLGVRHPPGDVLVQAHVSGAAIWSVEDDTDPLAILLRPTHFLKPWWERQLVRGHPCTFSACRVRYVYSSRSDYAYQAAAPLEHQNAGG